MVPLILVLVLRRTTCIKWALDFRFPLALSRTGLLLLLYNRWLLSHLPLSRLTVVSYLLFLLLMDRQPCHSQLLLLTQRPLSLLSITTSLPMLLTLFNLISSKLRVPLVWKVWHKSPTFINLPIKAGWEILSPDCTPPLLYLSQINK